MVSNYKRKTSRGEWSIAALEEAKAAVKRGTSLRTAARQYGVPYPTLYRHMKKTTSNKYLGRYRPVFTNEQEALLAEHLLKMDRIFFGLTTESLQKLAYDFAEMNSISHSFVNGRAGRGWIEGFMRRHPELTLRTPEPTSVARAVGFNRPQVERFFHLLRNLCIRHSFRAQDIFNCDETGLQTSGNRPPRVISLKGKRQVGLPLNIIGTQIFFLLRYTVLLI